MVVPESSFRRESGARLAIRALVAAVALAAPRAALVALRIRQGSGELDGFALRAGAGHLLSGLAWSLPVLLLATWCLARRRRPGLAAAVAAGIAGLGFAFATFRLPAVAIYLPTFDTSNGMLANAGAGVGALVAAWVAVPGSRVPALPTLGAVAFAVVAATGLSLALDSHEQAAWPDRPNVILISLDTLRADHLGCYGYERGTSPNLDAFAEDALRLDSAFAASSWTLTSHMTLLTSLSPSVHGVDRDRGLSPSVRTLATELHREGYVTLSVLDDCTWLAPRFGFDRGFQVARRESGPAAAKIDTAFELVDEAGDRPFFLFAHFYDVHSDFARLPYESDDADYAEFAGWYEGGFDGCGDDDLCGSRWLQELNKRGERLGDDERRYVVDLYDAGIRTLDRELARLFEGLERRGLLENSIVILTADHGEEFYEHGKLLHTQVFGECLRVPLIVRTPATTGGASDALVGLIDVMPTVLELCGIEVADLQGRSFAPLLDGRPLESPREHVVADHGGTVRVLRTDRWAVYPTAEGWRVYDATVDPRESHDLVAAGEAIPELEELRRRVREEEDRVRELAERYADDRPRTSLSPEEIRRLEGLGYGGGGDDDGD